jgi:2-keto-3-deoxy-L-rhamnonate aldolase RhmA
VDVVDSPVATEVAAGAGFDWLLIDMEHSANDISEVVQHLRAATAPPNRSCGRPEQPVWSSACSIRA